MKKTSVFISYSRKDEKEKDELIDHLRVLRQAVEVWSDDQLGAGADWKKEIELAMEQA